MLHALIVEDDTEFVTALSEFVRRENFHVTAVGSIAEARTSIGLDPPSLVLCDLELPDGNGMTLLQELQDKPDVDIVIVSGHATVDSAIEALRRGALDYLTKPLDVARLSAVLAGVSRTRSLRHEVSGLREDLRRLGHFGEMVGTSPAMQKIYDLVSRVAPTDVTVCILGESGTGKELVAQTIHTLSRRRNGPFVAINCGAVPATLIESELFGHERGSFTGATQMRKGHFERASGGTLFLDEITEMPIELQVRLLRVLETRTLTRIGGDESIPIDIRVIAAANRSLESAVREGKLREDLYYRLSVFPMTMPPLRERQDDAVLLAEHFLEQLNEGEGNSKRFSSAALEHIRKNPWRGNVRELKNEVHCAYILSEHQVDFGGQAGQGNSAPAGASTPGRLAGDLESIRVGASVAGVERQLILATLEHCKGDKKRAAEILGISLKTLYNRLNVYASSTRHS